MRAGRELDSIIAEKLMGWTKIDLSPNRRSNGGDIIGFGQPPYDSFECAFPRFSTDIEDAFSIIDKFSSGDLSGYGNRPIILDLSFWPSEKWRAELNLMNHHAGDDRSIWSGKAETVPLAICLAALDFANDE